MKRLALSSALVALVATASLVAQDDVKFAVPGATPSAPAAPASPAAPAAPAATFTNAQLLETFGWFIGRRVGLAELEFSADEVAAVVKGLRTAAQGSEAPYDLQQIGPAMEKFMQDKQSTYMEKLRQAGMAESAAFMAQIKAKEGVVVLPSGLAYEVLQPGTGAKPKANELVKVNYVGRLVDGTVFDANGEEAPAEVLLDQVIPGWSEGLQQLNVGSQARLYIPPHLAYGDDGQGAIPPSATLVFDVELLSAGPAPAAPTPARP